MPEFHELADAFPLLEDGSSEFAELVKDIETNGQLLPVVMYEGKILDGRNRYRAIEKINEARPARERMPHTEIKFETKYPDGDPVAYVWGINVVRRQLTPGQRDMAAQKLEELTGPGRPKATGVVNTRAKIAAKTGANRKGMERAKHVRDEGIPAVAEAVEKGTLPLRAADRIARLPEADQEEIMADPKPEQAVTRKETATAKKAPVKRNGPGPSAQMRDHMTGHSTGIRDVQIVGKFWDEHKELIEKLPSDDLRTFIKDLEETRAAASRLLHLIESVVLPEWPLDGRKPQLLSTALNKVDASKGAQSTWPEDAQDDPSVSVSGTLSPEAAQILERTAPAPETAAKAPAKPRVRKAASKTPKVPGTITASGAPATPATPGSPAARKATAKKPVPPAEFTAPGDPA